MWTAPCKCGRTAPRVRCIGRTDDMLIVRGVNVFPSAIREVVSEFAPAVSGDILVKPARRASNRSRRCRSRSSLRKDRTGAASPNASARGCAALVFTARSTRAIRQLAAQRIQIETRRSH